jgi:hypothetical protein
MLRLQQGIDAMGNMIVAGIQQSGTINNCALGASTAKYPTVPTGANFVLIAAAGGYDLWMLLGVTTGLAIPNADVTDGSSPELLPAGAGPYLRQIRGAATLGLICASSCNVTLSYFS